MKRIFLSILLGGLMLLTVSCSEDTDTMPVESGSSHINQTLSAEQNDPASHTESSTAGTAPTSSQGGDGEHEITASQATAESDKPTVSQQPVSPAVSSTPELAVPSQNTGTSSAPAQPVSPGKPEETSSSSAAAEPERPPASSERPASSSQQPQPEPCSHQWQAATCTLPKTCAKCGKTEGTPNGHHWEPASCTAARHCSVCGAVEGSALGHAWYVAGDEKSLICSRCGHTSVSANGSYTAADYDAIIQEVQEYAQAKSGSVKFYWEDSYTFSQEMGYFGIPFIEQEGKEEILRQLKRHVDKIEQLMAGQDVPAVQFKALWFIEDPGHTRFVVIYG